MNKNGITVLIVIIILILIGIIGYAYYSSPSETVTPTTSTDQTGLNGEPVIPPVVTTTDSATTVTTTSPKVFNVTGVNFSFSPSTITVNKGDTVRIVFTSTGGTHDFRLDEFNTRTSQLPTGQTQTVEFIADKAGSFEYYCSVGTHRQMGMVGTLVVI